ncbi:hypothetical protein [Brevibacillus parabrevis]|jgi:hypothetical protein|uniref:hypothetical protein n=1 Tax=Brevibacillus parabrevis TaxID=54914 RepID=UPI00248F94A6|nr:hypothetical protein [Brevibacillus parabrevis]
MSDKKDVPALIKKKTWSLAINCKKGGTIVSNPIRNMFDALSDLVAELHEKDEQGVQLTEADIRLQIVTRKSGFFFC